jgi:hypothetical protein
MLSDPTVILKGLPVIVLIILILFVGSGGKRMKQPTVVPSPSATVMVTPTEVTLKCRGEYDNNELFYVCQIKK